MSSYSVDELRALVGEGRIHRTWFLDPDLYELEMERIFERTWIFVGHESQTPKVGDFFCTRIGRQPVVMVRHTDGKVHVLYNRCAHRGAKVVNEEQGNAKRFQCLYHGWTYHTNGRIAGVPLHADYPRDFDILNNPNYGMLSVPGVASYRGFVFARLAGEGPDFLTFLGAATQGIDDLVDASPEGEIEFAGGCHRYQYAGNWKHQLENLTDTYHPVALHASTVGPDGQQFQRRPGEKGGKAAFVDEKGSPVILIKLGIETYPNGHSATGTLIPEEQSGGIVEEYRDRLIRAHGEARARQVLQPRLHNFTIFPTLDILIAQNAIRLVIPLSVNRTEVRIYPVRLKGAPPEVFAHHLRYLNLTHSASSFVQSDDVEAFRRVQEGLEAKSSDWCLVARGLHQDTVSDAGVGSATRASEIGQRHQHRAWLALMSAE
jgi:phenylpropionate dioxygenase-like ring-hydroxylating dioxygenase large terminal subunit